MIQCRQRNSVFALNILILFTQVISSQNKNGIVTMDKARFTVISHECLRLEYDEAGLFIDNPTLFADNRHARLKEFTYKHNSQQIIIETQRMPTS